MIEQRSQDSRDPRVAESVRRALLLVGPADADNRIISNQDQSKAVRGTGNSVE